MAEEGLKKTKNDLIHIGCPIPFDVEEFLEELDMKQLKDLYAKRNEEKKKELLKAVESSTKTYEEIMAFICSEGEIN